MTLEELSKIVCEYNSNSWPDSILDQSMNDSAFKFKSYSI